MNLQSVSNVKKERWILLYKLSSRKTDRMNQSFQYVPFGDKSHSSDKASFVFFLQVYIEITEISLP